MSWIMDISKHDINFKVYRQTAAPNVTGAFWNCVNNGSWEEETFLILDRFLDANHSYLDIGAWIGPTLIYGAHKAKHAYGIEPDQAAYHELVRNIELNPNILSKTTSINVALAASAEITRLYTKKSPGDSMSSIIPTISEDNYYDVRGLTIDELSEEYNIRDVNFIKMDIEAGEYYVISSMQRYLKNNRPTLYLSLHPNILLEENKHNPLSYKQVLQLTENLLENLNFYKYIYDIKGNYVDKNILLENKNGGAFVFTDEKW